jgi:hypothetical protein
MAPTAGKPHFRLRNDEQKPAGTIEMKGNLQVMFDCSMLKFGHQFAA